MKYLVTVKPNAKLSKIERGEANEFHATVKSPAQDGKANHELIKLIASFFNVPQSSIHIKNGASSRKKVVEIV